MASSSPGPVFDLVLYVEEKKRLVDARLDRCLPSDQTTPGRLHQAMRYSVFAGGKRIRPILALASAEAVSCSLERVLPLACALELLHAYSLIHDDLPAMDDDDFRRGQPTCHKVYGEGIAILAGNGLMARAFGLLAESEASKSSPERVLEVIRRLSRAMGSEGGVIGGQAVDLATEGRPFSADDLDYIHRSKTGALIRAAVTCPAVLCGVPDESLTALDHFGQRVGLAFQIVDDVLDVVGSREELGKTSGKDTADGKATYPALYGVEESRRTAERLVEEAVDYLEPFGTRAEALIELARFISIRRF